MNRVLVTGANGFVGSRILARLRQQVLARFAGGAIGEAQ